MANLSNKEYLLIFFVTSIIARDFYKMKLLFVERYLFQPQNIWKNLLISN